MTEPLGTATVIVKPDTTGFRRELQTKMNALKPVTVPVAAAVVPTKFTKDLKSKMKTAAPIPVPVAASANVGAFSRDLRRKLKTAPISVPVAATITGATAAAGGLGAVQRESRAAAKATDEFSSSTKKATRSMGQLERGAGATGLSMLGVRGATLAASGAFLAGAAAITLFAKAVQSAVSLQQQLSVFQATTGATAADMERVSSAAREMGRDLTLPGISAGDAATAMTELAKAGLSVEDAIDGARGVLQLAIAAQISFADATTLAASALNAFGLQGDEAVHVADILANAANAAQGSIQDMGLALQQSAAVGRQVGLSLQDTTTFLTIMAREGLRGSDAGTSLRVALGRLVNPTKKIQTALDRLGVALRDANGNIRPDFFVNLGVAMEGMSKAQKDATLATIGGMDAMRALSILTRQSIGDFIRFRKSLDEQGTASELAQARMVGLSGAASNLANTLQGIGISIGQRVTPALTGVTNALTSTISTISSVFSRINSAIDVRLILSAVAAWKLLPPVIGLATKAFTGVTAATIATELSLIRVAGVGATLRGVFSSLLLSINPVAVAVAAAGAALYLFLTRTAPATAATQALAQATSALSTAQSEAARTTRELADAQSSLQTNALAVDSARLAEAQARAALNNSQAAEGSIERRLLENQLAIAIDNVRVAEDSLKKSRQSAADAAAAASQAEINRDRALSDQAVVISQINKAEQGGLVTRSQVISRLESQARVQEELNTKESRGIAKRLRALASLRRSVDEVPTEKQIEVFLRDANFKRGLRRLVTDMDVAGTDGVNAMVNAILAGLAPLSSQILAGLSSVWNAIVDGFFNAGVESGQAFNRGLTEGMPRVGGGVGVEAPAFTPSPSLGQTQDVLETQGRTAEALVQARRRVAFWAKKMREATNDKDWTAALNAWKAASADEARLEQEILSNQQAAAATVKSAADDAQKKQDEADQAFLNALAFGEKRRFAIKEIQVQATKGLQDDIKLTIQHRNWLRAKMAEARREIHDRQLLAATLLDLKIQIAQDTADINRLKDERRKNQQAAKEAARQRKIDAIEEGIRLSIEIASEKGNTNAEISARRAHIKFLRKQQKGLKESSNAYKALQLEIEREKNAIRELNKKKKERDNAAKELFFSFLQTQQGFASTIMSNLLPAGSITGALGQTAQPGTQPVGITSGITSFSQTSQANARGQTQGQTAAMIEILRQILMVLKGNAGRSTHPEARRQHAGGSAEMVMM